tara:strand:- start:2820 stop:3341 length:522 start_codon:yes stop_codon:yes gene_type:complete
MAIPHVSNALRTLVDRLKREMASGGMLYPCKYYRSPSIRVEGISDLPSVTLVDYEDEEHAWGHGAKTSTGKSTNLVSCDQTVKFILAFNKEYGPYSDEGLGQYGLMDWVARFKDAIELDDTGCPDLMLDGSCIEPMYVNVDETEVHELSWEVVFEIYIHPKPIARGSRRLAIT